VLIDRENDTPLIIDTAVPLTHNFPKTDTEEIMKYDNLALEIKNSWKLNNVSAYPLDISVEGVVTKNFLQYLENIVLIINALREGQKALLLQACHTVCKFLGHAS
jgi:hypothetical protein